MLSARCLHLMVTHQMNRKNMNSTGIKVQVEQYVKVGKLDGYAFNGPITIFKSDEEIVKFRPSSD